MSLTMGWIQEQFERRIQSRDRVAGDRDACEVSFEALADQKWKELRTGLQQDVEEYANLGGNARFSDDSDVACRITNATPGITAQIVADPSAHTIHYTFESDAREIAVPEGGFFSVRRSGGNGAELYSADQQVSAEQARRMILEPLLFPNPPRIM
jgi:hypothetical protein